MSTPHEEYQQDEGYIECSAANSNTQEEIFVISRDRDSDQHADVGCRRGYITSLRSDYAEVVSISTTQSDNVDTRIQRSLDVCDIPDHNEEVYDIIREDHYDFIPADYPFHPSDVPLDCDINHPLLQDPHPCREHNADTFPQKFVHWKKVLLVVIVVVAALSIALGIGSMYIAKDNKSDGVHPYKESYNTSTDEPHLSLISTHSSTIQRETSTEDSYTTSDYITSTSSKPALRPFDCWEMFQNGVNTSGIYQIYPLGKDKKSKDVLCNMEISPGGWTVFQQRYLLDVDFNRNWSDYKNGFGYLHGDFWLGNEYLHLLTSSSAYITTMYLGVSNNAGKYWYESFDDVRFAAEDDGYRIYLRGQANGTAGDCSTRHTTVGKVGRMDDQKFSTFDRDNDLRPWQNCATSRGGGWWFNNCQFVFLNGPSGMDEAFRHQTISWKVLQ
ncbi:angiopoietin-related protein 7-like isoform X3 [Ostrea edulis]|uniref:angiopoietin-related protein 7-like isoform X3 n=1 Tax=Ostrea edulis TaxID=37623 RepID=UPI0024AF0B1C|nr:angiopoietin-related protein 7-like isoform X3 [Ostrea edulis]